MVVLGSRDHNPRRPTSLRFFDFGSSFTVVEVHFIFCFFVPFSLALLFVYFVLLIIIPGSAQEQRSEAGVFTMYYLTGSWGDGKGGGHFQSHIVFIRKARRRGQHEGPYLYWLFFSFLFFFNIIINKFFL